MCGLCSLEQIPFGNLSDESTLGILNVYGLRPRAVGLPEKDCYGVFQRLIGQKLSEGKQRAVADRIPGPE